MLIRRLLGLLTMVMVAPALAQEPVPVVPYHGVEIFCHLLHHLRFEPVESIADLDNVDPDQTLIVVFGDPTRLTELQGPALRPRGSAWLIAADPPRAVPSIRMVAWKLELPRFEVAQQNRALAYRQNRRCPLLQQRLDPSHPVFRGIKQGIATNGPGYLRSRGSDLFLLAAFDPGCIADDGENLELETVGYIFGSHADARERVLILAGQGVFINGMLAQADNDNVLFTLNALRWLKDGKRRHALVINDGAVVTRFDLPLTGTPPIPVPPVAVLNQMLRELEDEGLPRRLLEEAVGPVNLLRIGLILGTIAILFYGAKRLWGARHRQEHVPLVVGHVTPPPKALPLMEQRGRELLLQDNLWEPAQALARQWFIDHAGVEAPLWDQALGAKPPPCRVNAGWLSKQTLMRQVRQLWGFATRDPSRRVPVSEFAQLVALHQMLTEAVDEGRVEFARVPPDIDRRGV